MTRPLDGVLVADFSTLLPGPMASLILAEAGAEVVKVERPGGDDLRAYPPAWHGAGASFQLLNRGKRSLVLDLKTEAGRAEALALATRADVLLEQFRPGVMDRLGLGYETVRRHNPQIVYCAITGYGQTGPDRMRAGHDLNYVAEAGLLALSPGPPGGRTVPPALVADIAGGAYPAVMNILLGLRRRDATGEGVFLDVAMAENVLPFAFWALGEGFATGRWPGGGEGLLAGGSPRYRLYDTRDGGIVAVAALEEKFWQAFAAAIDLPADLRADRRDPAATAAAVAARIGARDAAEWAPLLRQADCCASVTRSLADLLDDPHLAARGIFAHGVRAADGGRLPALPVPVSPAFRAPPADVPAPASPPAPVSPEGGSETG